LIFRVIKARTMMIFVFMLFSVLFQVFEF
jgi:hypothetical protein